MGNNHQHKQLSLTSSFVKFEGQRCWRSCEWKLKINSTLWNGISSRGVGGQSVLHKASLFQNTPSQSDLYNYLSTSAGCIHTGWLVCLNRASTPDSSFWGGGRKWGKLFKLFYFTGPWNQSKSMRETDGEPKRDTICELHAIWTFDNMPERWFGPCRTWSVCVHLPPAERLKGTQRLKCVSALPLLLRSMGPCCASC